MQPKYRFITNKEFGFSMIEVLITIVIMAVGLLGVASLQTVGLRQTLNSQFLTQASFQGNDMAERMRANQQGVEDGNYDAIDGTESDPACLPDCTASQLAQHDAATWAAKNKALFNDNGTGSVTSSVTNNGDGTYTIGIAWSELAMPDEVDADGDAITTVANSYAMRFQP